MYHKVFILNIPSFYKINLFNELNKLIDIFVIFIAENNNDRTNDFILGKLKFDHIILNKGSFEKRNKIQSIYRTYNIFSKLRFNELIVGGWEIIEIFILLLFNRKKNNSFILESTIIESKTKGLKRAYKRLFLSMINKVFASGILHKKLLLELGFQKQIVLTRGVGIINKPPIRSNYKTYNKRFLYLGRLINEKNLDYLVSIFNDLPEHYLTIAGDGYLKDHLRDYSNKNINFISHIENDKISKLFEINDFLVLPSISETWGLVVEESLYFNTPVIISKNCGASELIKNGYNGIIINPYDIESTKNKIKSISKSRYEKYHDYINKNPLHIKDINQVKCYL